MFFQNVLINRDILRKNEDQNEICDIKSIHAIIYIFDLKLRSRQYKSNDTI